MAFEVEAWWTANYNKYSIRDLQRLPIFHRFVQIHYPFERSDDVHHERFYVQTTETEEIDIFEWTDKRSNRFERFQHAKKCNQYHYELRYRDEESPVTIKTWLQGELEWGTVVREYGTFTLQEGWRLEPPIRMYERFTEEQGIRKGFRAGINPLKGDYERWVEDVWEFGSERMFKKQWHKEGESGGETTNMHGDYTWGENWSGTPKRCEKKCWHKDGEHTWGHDTGKEPPRRWDHTWDFTPTEKYEEKVTVTSGRDTGYRYWGSKGDWYKQEWEGVKMLEREDRCEEVISAKLRERLDNLYQQELSSSLSQQQLLILLSRYLPKYTDRVTKLGTEIDSVKVQERKDVNDVLDKLEESRRIGSEQEELIKEMFGGFRDDLEMLVVFNAYFLGAMKDSMMTLEQIGKMIKDDSAYAEYEPKVKEFEEMPGGTVGKGKKGMDLIGELEKVKRQELEKFKGGIPQEEVEKAMETLYQIMVKHDAVSDKIVELTNAEDFKGQLDSMEDQFGQIHENYMQEGDPDKLHQMLNLLLEYQPIHLHLMNRLRGYTKDESNSEIGTINKAVEQTKSAPSLKNTRAKVRSGRPTRETPFQTMENHLNRFVPLLQRLLSSVDSPSSTKETLDTMLKKSVNSAEPVEVILEKTKILADLVPEVTPSIDKHENTLKNTDLNVNSILEWSYPLLEKLPQGQSEIQTRQELIKKSEETDYFPPLLEEKTGLVKSAGGDLGTYLGPRLVLLEKMQGKLGDLDREMKRFIPQYDLALKSLGTPEATRQPLRSLSTSLESVENPVEEMSEQVRVMNEVAGNAQTGIEEHDAVLQKTDESLNVALESGEVFLEKMEGGPEAVAHRKRLISESSSTDYFPPLIFLKSKNLREYGPPLTQYLTSQLQGGDKLQGVRADLNKFVPLYVVHLKSVGVPKEVVETAEGLQRQEENTETLGSDVADQAKGLLSVATDAQESISIHTQALQTSDSNINQYFQDTFPQFEQMEGAEEVIIQPRKELIERSAEEYLVPVILEKTEQLKDHSMELGLMMEEMQTETTTQVDTLSRELSDRALLLDDLRRRIRDLERTISILEPDLEEARRYKPLFEDKDQEVTRLSIDLKKLSLQHSDLALEMTALKDQLDKLTSEIEPLREFKRNSVDMVTENERLTNILKSYEAMLGDEKSQFDEVLGRLNDELAKKEAELRDLRDEIEKLKRELEVKEREKRRQLMLRIISALNMTIKTEKSGTFMAWKLEANMPEEYPKETILENYTNPADFLDEELSEDVLSQFRDTESPLISERTHLLTSNVITKHWKLSALKFEKPASPIDTFDFWLSLVSAMHSAALDDFKAEKRPLVFPEFTLEYLFKTFTSTAVVRSKLAGNLPGLYKQFEQGNPLAVVIARMVNLYSGQPLGLEGQVVVAAFRKEFQMLAEEYEKERSGTNPIAPSELSLTGGMVRVESVMEKFYTLFEDPEFFVEHWIRYLQPQKMSKLDFVLSLIHYSLLSSHIDPSDFWTSITDSSDTIDLSSFSSQVRSSLKLSTRLLQEILSTSTITKDYFLQKQSIDPDKWVVTLGGFLMGVTEAYMAKIRRAAVVLRDLHKESGVEVIDKDTFGQKVLSLDSTVSQEMITRLYEEALPLSASTSGLDVSAFIRILLRYPYGPLAKYPLGVAELGKFWEWHAKEYDLMLGTKLTTSTTTTTKTVKVVKKIVKKT